MEMETFGACLCYICPGISKSILSSSLVQDFASLLYNLFKARERHQCFKKRTGFQLWGMLKATCEFRYTYAFLETVFMHWLSESIKVITIHVDVRC